LYEGTCADKVMEDVKELKKDIEDLTKE